MHGLVLLAALCTGPVDSNECGQSIWGQNPDLSYVEAYFSNGTDIEVRVAWIGPQSVDSTLLPESPNWSNPQYQDYNYAYYLTLIDAYSNPWLY